jgi:hypothetical protein
LSSRALVADASTRLARCCSAANSRDCTTFRERACRALRELSDVAAAPRSHAPHRLGKLIDHIALEIAATSSASRPSIELKDIR